MGLDKEGGVMSDTYLKAILVSAVEYKLLKKLTIED